MISLFFHFKNKFRRFIVLKIRISKIMSAVISCVMFMALFIPQNSMKTLAICCRKDGFDKSRYTLTGNMAEDVATIAKSQKGRFCDDFGYTGVDWGAWCDEFVADCIENAGGDSSIVAHGGTVADFANKMMQRGAVRVTTPQTGDLVFFTYSHVEIVTKVVNGVVYSAGGNNNDPNTNTYHNGGCCAGEHRASSISYYLRPNYIASNNGNTFFDFWGVENGVTVNDTYKIWFKQVGLGDRSNTDVNLYIDGKESSNCLGTIYQDENGFFSYELDTTHYSSGQHTVYAVFRNTSGTELWVSRDLIFEKNYFFDFWGVDDEITVGDEYKVWLKQVGLGDSTNSDVNIYIDGKATENHLMTLYQDENGYFSYTLNTIAYGNGEHTIYAVFRNTAGKEIWVERSINIESNSFFGFWGVDDGITVDGEYKVWLKQVGLGDNTNSEVNIYIDGKAAENHLSILHPDDNGFYSFELNTLNYANGEHILYAVFRNTSDVEIWESKTIRIGNPDIAIDHLSGEDGKINISGWIADGVDWTSSCEAYIYIGEDCISHFVADTPSDDVGNHRYSEVINTKYYGDITLKIDAVDPVRGTIRMVYRDVTVTPMKPQLAIDHLSGGIGEISISGWAADSYDLTTTCEVNLYIGDDCIAHFAADTPSDDVGNHRYSKVIKTNYYGEQTLRVEAIDPDRNTSINISKDVTIGFLQGDCNNDGEFSLSDVVFLQKWLLAVPDTELANWQAADLCEDGRLDVFDLCLMKRMLVENS